MQFTVFITFKHSIMLNFMKKYSTKYVGFCSLWILLFLINSVLVIPYSIGQDFPLDCKLLVKKESKQIINSQEISFDTIHSSIFSNIDKPIILFYTFSGCTGCRIVKNDVIIPFGDSLKTEFNIDIVTIARITPKEKAKILDEYSNYNGLVYYDMDDTFFNECSIYVDDTKYKRARPRLLLLENQDKIQFIPFDYIFNFEALTGYLNEKQ